MLDVTQQEDLRAFLQASLLPENNSIIDGSKRVRAQTTEDLFKEYTPELTPEKLSGTYVGTTERVLAKNKEQLSTMPNIYGQAAMSELKLLERNQTYGNYYGQRQEKSPKRLCEAHSSWNWPPPSLPLPPRCFNRT